MSVPEIDVDTLADLQAAGAAIVDVRQPDEYEEGHVAGARLIPLGELPDRVPEVPNGDGPVYLICRSGGRSQRAAEFLQQHGIEAVNVAGGTLAWLDAGRPVISGGEPG